MVDLYALQIFLFELLLYEIKIMCRVCTEIEEKNNYGLKSRDPCWSCVQKTGPRKVGTAPTQKVRALK
jgi:hypothetical protein